MSRPYNVLSFGVLWLLSIAAVATVDTGINHPSYADTVCLLLNA